MSRKIIVEEVPVTDEFLKVRRIIQPRGELALIEDGKEFRHLAYFSLKAGGGFFRGGHYHRNKVEHFYVISGKLLIKAVDLATGERFELELGAGNLGTVYPDCAHRFEAREDAQVIEYFNSLHDPEDDVRYEPLLSEG